MCPNAAAANIDQKQFLTVFRDFLYPPRNLIPVNAALRWKFETGDGQVLAYIVSLYYVLP
jgi:hypothetical protein